MTPPGQLDIHPFTTDCERHAERVRLRVSGRLIESRPQTMWGECFEASSGTDVEVDLGAVTDIDARGLGLLADLTTRVRRAGGRVSVVRASPHVRRLLRVTHLDSLLADDPSGPRRAA